MNAGKEITSLNSVMDRRVSLQPGKDLDSHSARSVLAQKPTPASIMAVASEELTFQFSEAVEAAETALENKLSRSGDVSEKNDPIRIEQVLEMMKLMEGRDGYEALKYQAKAFSYQFSLNPGFAIEQLDLQAISPERRYAVIKMALEAIGEKRKAPLLAGDAAHELRSLAEKMEPSIQQVRALTDSLRNDKANGLDVKADLHNAIVLEPSVRSILDIAVEHARSGDLAPTLVKLQKVWGKQATADGLNLFAAVVVVQRIMQLISTMLHDSEKFLGRLGFSPKDDSDYVVRHTRACIDVAQSTMPASLIDKLTDSIKKSKRRCPRCGGRGNLVVPSCTCSDIRSYILGLLHCHAVRWPYGVWINSDAKKSTLEQLVKKQARPHGLAGKRLLG